MSIESEIRTRLLNNGTIAGLIGTRCYPLILPQDTTYPALVYSRVSGVRLRNIVAPSGRAIPRISIHSWGETYLSAQQLSAAVRASLDGFNGMLASIHASIWIENELDDYEDAVKKYRIIQDYFVNHLES